MTAKVRFLLIRGALYRIDRAPGDALRVLLGANLKAAPIYCLNPDNPGEAIDTEWKITIFRGAAVAAPNPEWPGEPVQLKGGLND